METAEHTTINLCGEELDPESKRLLTKTATWAKFLAMVGFTFLGLFIVGVLSIAIVAGVSDSYAESMSYMYDYMSGTIIWIYVCTCLIVSFIYFFPLYYLYRFSVRMKQAIPENNQVALIDAFRFLSKHYAFIGVLTLIMLFLLTIALINVFVAMV